jgi:hypothetical protein
MDSQSSLLEPKKNLICNFRAPNEQLFQRWKAYGEWVKENGLDICRVTLGLADSFMKGIEETTTIKSTSQVINIQQNNQFLYQVSKPRREPYNLICVKSEFRRTFSSVLFEAYVMEKAREINREFSYRDFLELKHDAFRRIVLRLKRKGKVMANPLRTVPRFYMLAERLNVK